MKMNRWRFAPLLLLLCVLLTSCGGSPATSEAGQTEAAAETPDAQDWQAQYDLGVRYLSEGNYQEAILAFTAAIEIDPKQSELYAERGGAYLTILSIQEEKDEALADKALADFLRAIEMDPGKAEYYAGMADAYHAKKDYRAALDGYLQAIELDGQEPEYYKNAAREYRILGDRNAAEDLLRLGIERTGSDMLREELEKMMHGCSRVVTVSGTVFWNGEVYAERILQIDEVKDDNFVINGLGIRFDAPVEVVIDGETFRISTADIMYASQKAAAEVRPLMPEIHNSSHLALNGYFEEYETDAEVVPFHSDSSGYEHKEYELHLNEPYSFHVTGLENAD